MKKLLWYSPPKHVPGGVFPNGVFNCENPVKKKKLDKSQRLRK